MKKAIFKAILLTLVFIGYQFMASLLFVLINVLKGADNISELDTNQLSLSLLLSGILVIAHLFYCRDVVITPRDYRTFPMRCLWINLPLLVSAMYLLNVGVEALQLTDLNRNAFIDMSHNAFGVLSMALVGPVTEELLFRGAITGGMLRRGCQPAVAVVVSSFLFALIHMNPAQMPFAFLLGCLFAWVYYRTDSLLPSVVCHVVNNAAAVVSMWMWSEDDPQPSLSSHAVPLLLAAVVFVVSLFYANRIFPKKG